MDFTATNHRQEKQILLSGQFTFADSHKFKQIVELLDDTALRSIALDFSSVEFIDSAGLGMLLLLRDECQNRRITISIHSPQGQVQKIFMISKFDQLFSMHGEI